MDKNYIAYIGMMKVGPRKWVHIGYDEKRKAVIPMPRNLIPNEPEKKSP